MSGSLMGGGGGLSPQLLATLMQMHGGGGSPAGLGNIGAAGMASPSNTSPMSGYIQPQMGGLHAMPGAPISPGPPSMAQAMGAAGGGMPMVGMSPQLLQMLTQMKQGQTGVAQPNGMAGGQPTGALPGGAGPGAMGGQTPGMISNQMASGMPIGAPGSPSAGMQPQGAPAMQPGGANPGFMAWLHSMLQGGGGGAPPQGAPPQ